MPPPLPYKPIAGVVPCPGGWLVQPARLFTATIVPEEPLVLAELNDVLDYRPSFLYLVIDAPIGIPDRPFGGYRACDREARDLLGWPRRVSVAPVPCREALYATTLAEAQRLEPWLTPLAYRRFRWWREADTEIHAYHQRRIFSGSPELSFLLVNGDAAASTSSFWRDGPIERLALLQERLPGLRALAQAAPPRGASLRHVLNAAALLWTARRIAGRAITRLPRDPMWDDQGRRIELVR
jgi:predicted RNase H-like nuclease